MANFFKNFGKGILYVLVLPFLLVGLAVYGVVALFIFLFMAVKALILFFTGRSIFDDTEEDKEAKKRIAKANGTYVEETPVTTQQEEATTTATNIDDDPFYIPDYMKTDEDRERAAIEDSTINEPEPQFEEEKQEEIFEQQVEEKVEINEEIPQKSPQNDAFLAIEEDEEDESKDSSGVDIHFD